MWWLPYITDLAQFTSCGVADLVAGPGQEQGAVQLVGGVQEGGAGQHHAPRRPLLPLHLLLQNTIGGITLAAPFHIAKKFFC